MNGLCEFLLFLASVLVLSYIPPGDCNTPVPDTRQHHYFKYEDPETEHQRRCAKCSSGTYVAGPCFLTEHDTECEPCPSGSYTDGWNELRECTRCTECPPDRMSAPCTITADTECHACPAGFFWHNQGCKEHKKCPTGRGVKLQGTTERNTVCERCTDGTYSDIESSILTCQPFTDCHDLGLEVITLGDRFKDAVCNSNIITTQSVLEGITVIEQEKTTIFDRPDIPVVPGNIPHAYVDDNFLQEETFIQEEFDYFEEELPQDNLKYEHPPADNEKTRNGKVVTREHDQTNEETAKEHEQNNDVGETSFKVEDVEHAPSSSHSDVTSNGSGLAAGILGAGCLFMLILIVILYHRKKHVEERQRIKRKQQELPQWQKIEQQGASRDHLDQSSTDEVEQKTATTNL